MQVQASTKSVQISPRKVRLVADAIRNMPIDSALGALQLMRKRAAWALAKTLKSAMANAENNAKLDKNNLRIVEIQVGEGRALKRFHPSTRGRIHPYKKRTSHITITVEEVKQNGTKS